MTKVLILGGTRFFGKKLVERFIQNGAEVTILTRGNAPDSYGDSVSRLIADRTDSGALEKAIGTLSFDLVYDNICFGPEDAESAVRLFADRTGKYIVTSSLSVYPFGGSEKEESEFKPYEYPLPMSYPTSYDYGEGKRLVEAVTFQKSSLPSVAVRFPIVLGHDDYTRRLHFHIEHIQENRPIGIPNLKAKMSYINSDEAADFLYWLGQSKVEGPVNASSTGAYTLSHLISLIEEATGQTAQIQDQTDPTDMSPFGIPASWYMSTSKASMSGFTFKTLDNWLPLLIEELINRSKK